MTERKDDPVRPWDLSVLEQAAGNQEVIRRERTRRLPTKHVRFILALGLLLIIGAMAITGAVHWATSPSGQADLKDLVVLMSPITTLAGAVFAFYFTDTKGKKRRK